MTAPELLLEEAHRLVGLGPEALRSRSTAGVQVLRITGTGAFEPSSIARFGDVEALVVDVVPVTGELLAAIAALPRLRALAVCSDRAPLATWSGGLHALEVLSLPQLDEPVASFETFLHAIPNLRVLRIPDARLCEPLPFMTAVASLRELDLTGVPMPQATVEVLRRARPDLVVRTSPINLGWAPGIPGVLRVADGFALDDQPSAERWISAFETSIIGRQITLTVRWQDSPADGPVYQEERHGPFEVEAFIRNGPPIAIRSSDRARLRQRLEAKLSPL